MEKFISNNFLKKVWFLRWKYLFLPEILRKEGFDMQEFAEKLLGWYRENGRSLPWRDTQDPYRIWVSEIILQQTRVAQGYEYYERFVRRFPDVRSLADADEDEVMKYWQGLGYYSRARHLHAAAKSVAAMGRFPATYEEVRRLQGVGDYTAAAICAFAYGLPCAVVDGNVYRVISRWMGIDEPIDTTAGKKLFAALARELMGNADAALYNQAIMDFGALQCTPSSPNCLFCPLNDTCRALREGKVNEWPRKSKKTKVTERYFHYIFVRSGAYTYINKRGKGDIWQHLYELPLFETDRPMAEEELLASSEWKAFFGDLEPTTVALVEKGVRHVLSHRVLIADCHEVVLADEALFNHRFRRVLVSELQNFAVPRLVSHFFSLLLEPNQ